LVNAPASESSSKDVFFGWSSKEKGSKRGAGQLDAAGKLVLAAGSPGAGVAHSARFPIATPLLHQLMRAALSLTVRPCLSTSVALEARLGVQPLLPAVLPLGEWDG
jgi:hypothetical protein